MNHGRTYVSQKRSIVRPRKDFGASMMERKITIRLPENYIEEIDFLVQVEDFSSRSEAIRMAVRDMLYQRVDMVMEKADRKIAARRRSAKMKEIEDQYLQR